MEIEEQVRRQWRDWALKNIGGPEARVEIATQAAVSALGQGKSRDEAAVVAREASSSWEKTQAPAIATTSEPGGGLIRGRVAAMQQRQEMRRFFFSSGSPFYSLVWDFRLDRNEPPGPPSPSVSVELRSSASAFYGAAKGFEGSVLNGDVVVIDARDYKPGKVLQVEQVWNLTSHSVVRERGSSPSRVLAGLAAAKPEKYGVVRGRVVAMQQRQDRPGNTWKGTICWSFRVQRFGPDGSPLPLVEIEMRSDEFEGSIAVGDEVELDASGYKTGDIVSAKQVRNFSSNSVVRVR